jgi:hypothetical protein
MLSALIVVAGCAEPTRGFVSGTITVDGAPAKSGSIAFFPVDGKSSTTGGVITEGQYRAEVPFGAQKVEIRVPKKVGEKKAYDAPNSPMIDILAESLPAKYNDATELTLDVKPGENQKDFQLKTK